MDEMMEAILEQLRAEASKIGADLIRDGLDLVEARLKGEATSEELMAWLRSAQGDAA